MIDPRHDDPPHCASESVPDAHSPTHTPAKYDTTPLAVSALADLLALALDDSKAAREGWPRFRASLTDEDLQALADARAATHHLDSLAGVSGFGRLVGDLRRRMPPPTAASDADQGTTVTLLRSRLTQLPPSVPTELVMPPGYDVCANDEIWYVSGDKERRVMAEPAFVSGLWRDAGNGSQHLDLTFRSWGAWKTVTVDRETLSTARALVSLSLTGLDVATDNARDVVRYVRDCEQANHARLTVGTSATALGWYQTATGPAFLTGEDCIGTGDVRLITGDRFGTEPHRYGVQGTVDEWKSGVWDRVKQHPAMALGVVASFASAVLGLVPDAPNSIIEWAGRAGGGKSTTLQAAASVWGPPTLMGSWSTTTNAVEIVAAFGRHHPLILDDTRNAPQRRDGSRPMLGEVVYLVANGRSKSRATANAGLRAKPPIRTILLSTGETRITDATQDPGTRRRCLVVEGFPMKGGETRENGETADALKTATGLFYGAAGRQFASWLASHPDRWDTLRARWHTIRDRRASTCDNAFLRSHAATLATLEFTADLLEHALGIVVSPAVLDVAERAALAAARDADRALAALHIAWDVFASERARFPMHGTPYDGSRSALGCTLGTGTTADPHRPGFTSDAVNATLAEHGHDPHAIRSEWARRGWLETTKTRNTVKRILDGVPVQLVALSREAVDALQGGGGDE